MDVVELPFERLIPYNTVRPHSSFRYRPPAPESIVPIDQCPTMH